jgi:hypothetical protein
VLIHPNVYRTTRIKKHLQTCDTLSERSKAIHRKCLILRERSKLLLQLSNFFRTRTWPRMSTPCGKPLRLSGAPCRNCRSLPSSLAVNFECPCIKKRMGFILRSMDTGIWTLKCQSCQQTFEVGLTVGERIIQFARLADCPICGNKPLGTLASPWHHIMVLRSSPPD